MDAKDILIKILYSKLLGNGFKPEGFVFNYNKVKELLKYPCEDYDIVVEIGHEEHNLDFLVDGSNKKIIFFYDYGDSE